MIRIRKANARGHANHGWLDSWFSFSFAEYYDPQHMGFSVLRVINDDVIAPGQGFGMHGHADMEIITYVLEGAVQHKDSLGNGSIIVPGEVQRMSAGSGIRHSEFNPSATEQLHLLQIWLRPNQLGVQPGYEQKAFDAAQKRGRFCLVASPDGAEGSVTIHQDARLYAALVDGEESLTHAIAAGRRAYLHVARGAVKVQGEELQAGDAVALEDETEIRLDAGKQAEVLLFDLP